jgi:hypothetical protein
VPAEPWRPSRFTAILLAVLTIWPFIYIGLFFAMFFFMWVSFGTTNQRNEPPDLFKYIFPLHCSTMLLIFGLVAVYVIHAYRTDAIPNDKKVLWVVILFLGNMLAFPIYWYLFIWRETSAATRRPPESAGPPEQPVG